MKMINALCLIQEIQSIFHVGTVKKEFGFCFIIEENIEV